MKRLFHIMPLVLALLTATACLQRLEPIEDSTASHSVRLIVDGNVQPYDAEAGTKAAEAISWKTGDVIYIRTTTGSGTNTCYAQREADGSWTLNYTGALRSGAAAQCCFIQKAKSTSGYAVSLSYNSIIYEDKAATLTVSDGTVTLSTTLKPKTGRISFHGGTSTIGVSKLAWYTSFDLETFEFTECANANVSSFATGASKYFYGFFPEDNTDREIIISNDGLIFKRSFGTQVLRSGASGYIDVPTHTDYAGWTLTNESELDKYQAIEIEDPNFKAWLVARYDKDDDGEISKGEAAKITSLVCDPNDEVTSLKGIEYFTELTKLTWRGTCIWSNGRTSYGKLTQVDLSGNTKLQELDLGNNQLTSLDITGNPKLRSVNLEGNKLTTLSLSGGASLTSLNCNYNQLTSLNLSGCPYLLYLYCSDNQIATIDVSPCVQLLTLSVSDNKLSSLDVSSLSKLQRLECNYNQLTSLDVTACPGLTSLWLNDNAEISSLDLTNCPHLQELSFPYTAITSIDLSICPEISYLQCNGCKLGYLDLSALSDLYTLYCYDCGLTTLDLSNNSKLRNLGCGGNNLGALELSDCLSLEYVSVSGCGLTGLDLSMLSNLRDLSCSNNDFSSSGLDLSYNSKLTELYCGSCGLSVLDVAPCLKLRRLDCSSNYLTVLDVYDNSELNCLYATGMPGLEIILQTGHQFPSGFYYDEGTTITYVD